MKNIILIIITILSINIKSQEIHSNEFYSNYKKNINKLELFLNNEGYKKQTHNIWYETREGSYNHMFVKGNLKIFIIIPKDKMWIDPMTGIEEHAECFYFSNKVKTFINDKKEEIYIIKRG
tara:strand:+ start:844 stop:1206 length:363 start_codon:yes stop_codon:yes gene_type:complete